MPRWRRPLVLLLAAASACTTTVEADVRALLLDREWFPVSMDASPEDSVSLGFVAVRDTGFYPFGFIPIVPLSMQACVDEMVHRARLLGGDGISRVTIEYEQPSSFLSFSVIFIPDWFGSVTISGSVWKRVQPRPAPDPPMPAPRRLLRPGTKPSITDPTAPVPPPSGRGR